MVSKTAVLLVFSLVFLSLSLVIFFLGRPTQESINYLAPVATKTLTAEVPRSPKKVFAFLPFWNLAEESLNDSLKNIDVPYYFAITTKGTGDFDRNDPGWTRMGTLKKFSRRFGLTIANMDRNDIAAIISSPARRQKVITNTLDIMASEPFTDLNLDFEYAGTPPDNLVANFTLFVEEFATALHSKNKTLSVAVFADAAWKKRLYDVTALSRLADYLIVMAYDFTRLNSAVAGPVAPLFGKERHEYDVYSTILDYLAKAAPEKIVLGIPFYGYEWPVVNNEPGAFVLGVSSFGPALSSYKRTLNTAKENSAAVNFDDYSKSPWFSYFDQDSRTWRQVWFENERSLGLKLDLVNQAGLAGIAIWALGYEGPAPSGAGSHPLWQVINEKTSH